MAPTSSSSREPDYAFYTHIAQAGMMRCHHCKKIPPDHSKDGDCLFSPTKYRQMTVEQWEAWRHDDEHR